MWIKVQDSLPVVPKNKYAVSVLVAEFDPCYDEINPGKGYSVRSAIYGVWKETGKEEFLTLVCGYGVAKSDSWEPFSDVVTHWMPWPEPPEYSADVLNPIFQHYHDTALPQSPLKQL